TFLSSGFDPAPTMRRQTPPLSEAIRKLVRGPHSGQALLTLGFNPDAYSYQLRWRRADDASDDGWEETAAGNTRPATLIEGLTPGVTYIIQVRIMKADGYGDWTDPVTYIAT